MLTLPDDLPPSAQSAVVSPSARVNSLVDGPLVGTVAEYKLNPKTNKHVQITPSGEWTSANLYLNI